MIVCRSRRLHRTISNCMESYKLWGDHNKLNIKERLYASRVHPEDCLIGDKFTNIETERILSILNSSNAEQLSRFNITQGRLRNLIAWKNKKGPFTTLSDLLEVDGLGINLLNKFCESILSETSNYIPVTQTKQVANRQKRDLLMPTLTKADINEISSAVGLHIESTGISWAKLEKVNNELVNWNYCDFSTVPKKTTPVDTFTLAIKIMKSLPPADVYIFANKSNTGTNNNSAKTPYYTLQLELRSMLLGLINTSEIHNPNKLAEEYSNKVYYLGNNIPARLFGALVGSERVSTEATISSIISGDANSGLPCSKVTVGATLITDYSKCVKGYKDLLEQSLLLVITFMDLYVYNNPVSLKAVRIRR